MKRPNEGHGGSARIVEFALLIGLPVLFHYFAPIRMLIPRSCSYLGAIVMLLALGLMNWASALFRKAGTGFQLQYGGSAAVV
jgi:hypothetical protein